MNAEEKTRVIRHETFETDKVYKALLDKREEDQRFKMIAEVVKEALRSAGQTNKNLAYVLSQPIKNMRRFEERRRRVIYGELQKEKKFSTVFGLPGLWGKEMSKEASERARRETEDFTERQREYAEFFNETITKNAKELISNIFLGIQEVLRPELESDKSAELGALMASAMGAIEQENQEDSSGEIRTRPVSRKSKVKSK